MQIIPSINGAQEFLDIEYKLKQLEALPEGLIEWVHLDFADGKFASPKTWPFSTGYVGEAVKDFEDLKTRYKLALHLMVKRPGEHLDMWLDAPVSRIAIHDETGDDIADNLAVIDMTKVDSCVVLKMETAVSELASVIQHVDVVQMMSIDTIGPNGAAFNEKIFDKIKECKKLYPDKPLIIDGGINAGNIAQLAELGVENVVVGSAVWENDTIEENLKKLKKVISG